MKKLIIFTTIFSLILATSSKAEVTKKYDQFKGTTTIFIRPDSTWNGNTPTLYMDTEMTENENKSSYIFGVVFKTTFTDTCASGVTGVIADGERLKTRDEISRQSYGTPKMKVVKYTNGTFGKQAQYLALMERYYPIEFQKIANAQSVKYQLCGKDEWVYELTPKERTDLKEYIKIVMPEVVENPTTVFDLLERTSNIGKDKKEFY